MHAQTLFPEYSNNAQSETFKERIGDYASNDADLARVPTLLKYGIKLHLR